MMRAVVNLFIAALAIHLSLHAADKPVWTLDAKALGVPEMWLRNPSLEAAYSAVRLQFSSADDVMVSFRQRRTPSVSPAQRDVPANSSASLVLLLFAKEDGKLVNRSDWPVTGEEDLATQFARGSRLQSLPSGGYVGIISGHLQVMDFWLRVLHDKVLGGLRPDCDFDLVAPLSGSFFVLAQQCTEFKDSAEVIDSRTFTTAERWDIPGVRVEDIWGDRLLAVRETEHARYTRAVVEAEPIRYIIQEKRVGGSWVDTGLAVDGYRRPRFTNDGDIVVARRSARGSTYCDCWSVIDGRTEAGPPACYPSDESIAGLIPARKLPVIAVEMAKTTGLRAALDMNGQSFAVVHDLETRRKLLTTQAREDVIGYALSSDGRYLTVLTKKRLEMYAVPRPNGSKN